LDNIGAKEKGSHRVLNVLHTGTEEKKGVGGNSARGRARSMTTDVRGIDSGFRAKKCRTAKANPKQRRRFP